MVRDCAILDIHCDSNYELNYIKNSIHMDEISMNDNNNLNYPASWNQHNLSETVQTLVRYKEFILDFITHLLSSLKDNQW